MVASKLALSFLAALPLSACVVGEYDDLDDPEEFDLDELEESIGETSQEVMTTNGMSINGMSINGMSINGMSINGLGTRRNGPGSAGRNGPSRRSGSASGLSRSFWFEGLDQLDRVDPASRDALGQSIGSTATSTREPEREI